VIESSLSGPVVGQIDHPVLEEFGSITGLLAAHR
jgi:hypothetical protein